MRLHAVGLCIISSLAAAQEIAPAKLTIRATAPESIITIDGELRGLAPRTEMLPPGIHTIVAETRGAQPVTQTVSLTSGEARTLTMSFDFPAQARPFPIIGTVMVATGGLLIGAGLLLREPAERAARDVSLLFEKGGGWDARAQRIEYDGLLAETWSWLLVGVGVTTVVSGVTVALIEYFGLPNTGPKLAIAPMPGGAFVTGAFTW